MVRLNSQVWETIVAMMSGGTTVWAAQVSDPVLWQIHDQMRDLLYDQIWEQVQGQTFWEVWWLIE